MMLNKHSVAKIDWLLVRQSRVLQADRLTLEKSEKITLKMSHAFSVSKLWFLK